jgi:hypothetical protein
MLVSGGICIMGNTVYYSETSTMSHPGGDFKLNVRIKIHDLRSLVTDKDQLIHLSRSLIHSAVTKGSLVQCQIMRIFSYYSGSNRVPLLYEASTRSLCLAC